MMERRNGDHLRQMSYSELRKYARQSGIKGNLKAADLIASILEKDSHDDSFVALENKIINSCSKFKEEKFNKDKLVTSATPRRDTYTVDSPMDDIMALQKELAISSASPVLRKSPDMNGSLNVTMTRGSERKMKRKVSFVTPVRRSVRLSAITPQFASVKDRPKTPIPNRGSTGRKAKRPSTPLPQSKQKRRKLSSTGTAEKFEMDASTSLVEHLPLLKEVESEKHISTSNAEKTPITVPAAKVIGITPMSNTKSNASPCVSSTKRKGTATPNFSKLHQKAFDKMESIEEYQKRKAVTSAKKLDEQKRLQDRLKTKKGSKIPKKFGGIPFIPSVTNVRDIRTNFAVFAQNNSLMDKKPVASVSHNESTMSKKGLGARRNVLKSKSCENTPLRKRTKFDIQASLSKKLPYKPHTGPLKPITGPLKPLSALNLSLTLPIGTQQKEPENRTIQAKRIQSRTLLKGVRTNRRFELQMQNRKP